MAIVSVSQFKGMIETALEYDPRRGRYTHDHMSSEIYDGVGNTVHGIRVKFFVEDDGGTWDGITIAKPTFIWDMVKISAGSVIDDGSKRADLLAHSVRDTDDGIEFYETQNSYLGNLDGSISVSNSGLNWDKAVFNCWFTPQNLQTATEGNLIHVHQSGITKFYVGITPDNINPTTNFRIHLYINTHPTQLDIDRIVAGSSVMPLLWGKKYNIQITTMNGRLAFIVNGFTLYDEADNATSYVTDNISFSIGKLYRGEISYMTLYVNQWVLGSDLIKAYWELGYPLPRLPEKVDLSDQFETSGRNLFIDVRNIEKAIENLKGQLYVKTNTVKLRSD